MSVRQTDANTSQARAALIIASALLGACVNDSRDDDFRAQPEPVCVGETGEFVDGCVGNQCAVEHDFLLRCPGDASVDDLQIALDRRRVWGSFRIQGGDSQAFRIKRKKGKLQLLDSRPGKAFTGQPPDGTRDLNVFGDYVGVDAKLGRVGASPRPDHGNEGPPIATLRQGSQRLSLLSITDGDNWTEAEIAGTEPHEGVCPSRYNANDPSCPPCMSATSGIEDAAYQITRTRGGELWAAWFVTDAIVDMQYTASPFGASWRCTGTPSSIASGTLHLVELGVDGSPLRSLELALDDVGFHPSGNREIAIAAFRDHVALMLPTQHYGAGDGQVAVRVLVVDTAELE